MNEYVMSVQGLKMNDSILEGRVINEDIIANKEPFPDQSDNTSKTPKTTKTMTLISINWIRPLSGLPQAFLKSSNIP